MNMRLITFAAVIVFSGAAHAGEGYDSFRDFTGVPPSFMRGTVEGRQAKVLADYFAERAERRAIRQGQIRSRAEADQSGSYPAAAK
jgi:hypothetical protein